MFVILSTFNSIAIFSLHLHLWLEDLAPFGERRDFAGAPFCKAAADVDQEPQAAEQCKPGGKEHRPGQGEQEADKLKQPQSRRSRGQAGDEACVCASGAWTGLDQLPL